MINEKRMEAFEAVYAELHDVIPDTVKLHRFKTEESYSLPGLAHDYRMYCAALDSVVIVLPSNRASLFERMYGPNPYEDSLGDSLYAGSEVVSAIECAGLKVKP